MTDPQQVQPWQGSGWAQDPDRPRRLPSSLPYNSVQHSVSTGLRAKIGYLRRISSPGSAKGSEPADDVKGPLGLTLLHNPSEPRLDFVFVHGLGGGSRKTWSASAHPDTFWPKEWLPYELGFKNVRIHSFGYDADWSSTRPSSLTIHDFGQALLLDLSNSPHLKKDPHTPIVLIAHSMGGLVIKKAYLIATRDPLYRNIASRIHSLYFLGTPHRGADSAQLLSTFLSMKGSKAFVKDLIPGSGALQAINDEFRHVCTDIQLWSFFEGAPTSGGPTSVIIVDKESAVLDLPGEHKRYLSADHRNICKYASPNDPNYVTLRNCFRTTIDEIEKDFATQRHEDYRAQMKLISQAFGNAQRPEEDLLTLLGKRHDQSCVWLTEHRTFHLWLGDMEHDDLDPDHLTTAPTTHRTLWLNGLPGSGKSVIASHVIQYLQAYNSIDCAYFFFKGSTKVTVTQVLLSFAIQMAETNFEIRKAFLTMIEDGESLNSQDHTVVWNRLFLGRLLKTKFPQSQFWVIDALDEFPSRQLATLIQMFSKIDSALPLKIFMTSRSSDQVELLLNQEGMGRYELHTGQKESHSDISAYLQSQLSHVSHRYQGEGDNIMYEILEKSNGVFLWASLIAVRLQDVYTVETVREVLTHVPPEMSGLYQRILESVKNSPSALLAHCVLKWIVCSPLPPSTEELKEAVRLDINQTLMTSDNLPHICGNFITIDSGSRVHLMHQTVREFLTSSQSGDYIKQDEGHTHLASRCLEHLNNIQFTPQRSSRHGILVIASVSAFDDYAFSHFSYHFAHCSAFTSSPDLLALLANFLNRNLLAWIERTARAGRLSPLKKAIENLRSYLNRSSYEHSPLEPEHQMILRLLDDSSRILSIFGPVIVDMPSSIYSLIPIICPSTSLFYQKFGKQHRQQIICNFNELWDERLSCLPLPSQAFCVDCNDQHLAVGLLDGTIRIYRASTFELHTILQHGEPVLRLTLGTVSNVLVSSSPKSLILWDSLRTLKWSTSLSNIPLSLRFSSDESKVLVPMSFGDFFTYRAADGQELTPKRNVNDSSDSESDSDGGTPVRKVGTQLVRLYPELNIMGVAGRSSHLRLYSIENHDKIGVFQEKESEGQRLPPQILDIAFSSLRDLNLAAVAYQGGAIVTFNTITLQQIHHHSIFVSTLASSPNGRILGASANDATISLFVFKTLQPIHRISTLNENIQHIVFAANSTRLFDIRGNRCNVWEPLVLIRKNFMDDGSREAEEHNLPVQETEYKRRFEKVKKIKVITQAGSSNFIFCGREDGRITYHDLHSGKMLQELTYHKYAVIQQLEWHAKTQTLLSSDVSRCVATQFSVSPSGQLQQMMHVFDHKTTSRVKQIIINADASAILLSTEKGEELWDAENGEFVASENSSPSAQWLVHPDDVSRLLLLEKGKAHIFQWKGLKRETGDNGAFVNRPIGCPTPSSSVVWFTRHGTNCIATMDSDSPTSAAMLYWLDLSQNKPSTADIQMNCIASKSIPQVKAVLGVHRSNLYFITKQGWVCSLSLKSLPSLKSYIRHFFIPALWQDGTQFACKILPSKSVAFAYRDELVIFRAFLEFEDKVLLDDIDFPSLSVHDD